jgi:hypothetical protein
MAFKFGVFGGSTGNTKENPGFNQQVFATHEEAHCAGFQLLLRWFAPNDFLVVEVDEPVNYRFVPGKGCEPIK